MIYPYGKWGKIVQSILDECGIKEYIIVDANKENSGAGIYGPEILKQEKYVNYRILLCSNNMCYYRELWNQVLAYVPRTRVVDVCVQDYLFAMLQFSEPRVASLECVAREIKAKGIKGNVAEAGVYQGGFAAHINRFFPDRNFYLIDTFEGFDPRDSMVDVENRFSEGNQDWGNTNVEFVLSKMRYADKCIVKKGYFPETMQDVEDTFCFVSLDMDLYQPIYAGLQYFYPRLSRGGYIFIHDCRNPGYLGARKAVLQFCDEMGIGYVPLSDDWGTAVITK